MLEEAFIGNADDIFDQQSLSHPTLSSTPHRNPLHSSSLRTILSLKSPNDLPSSKDDSRHHNRGTTDSVLDPEGESNNWEASYVNKMKKQQKSNKNVMGSRGPTGRRQSNEKKMIKHKKSTETREEFYLKNEGGRAVSAKMNGRGKVMISIQQREDDDSENEEVLKRLQTHDDPEDEESEQEEEEWDG